MLGAPNSCLLIIARPFFNLVFFMLRNRLVAGKEEEEEEEIIMELARSYPRT